METARRLCWETTTTTTTTTTSGGGGGGGGGSARVIKCQNCDDVAASLTCLDCASDLCAACSATFHKFKLTSAHTVLPLAPAQRPRAELRCREHAGAVLSACCTTCEEPVCSQCQDMQRHAGHEFRPVEAFFAPAQQACEEVQAAARAMLRVLAGEAAEHGRLRAREAQEAGAALAALEQGFDAVVAAVEARRRDVRVLVEAAGRRNVAALAPRADALSDLLRRTHALADEARLALTRSRLEMVGLRGGLRARLLDAEAACAGAPAKQTLRGVPVALPLDALLGAVQAFGAVGLPEPPAFTAHAVTASSAALKWEASAGCVGAARYVLECRSSQGQDPGQGEEASFVEVYAGVSPSFTALGLAPGSRLDYRVRAQDDRGVSEPRYGTSTSTSKL